MKEKKTKLSTQLSDTNQKLKKKLKDQINLKEKSAKEWVHVLSRYKTPNHFRSVVEIAITSIPFVCLWLTAVYFYKQNYFLSLVFIIPSALLLVRLFCIQHDCGHGTFFRNKKANDWVGRTIGVFTFTPYELWKRDHATHHSNSGNLKQRGVGDVTTLTLEEYKNLSLIRKINYRIYRTPLVMFLVGPAWLFILRYRLPFGRMKEVKSWVSTMGTNLSIGILLLILLYTIGVGAFFLVHIPIFLLAAAIGVWMFYIQHQFEETVWENEENWNPQYAALYGSSHYDLPFPLRWFTANIGIHHIHHLHSKIPYYRLPKILRDYPQLGNIGRVGFWKSFKSMKLHLWDESSQKLISFKEYRHKKSSKKSYTDRV